MTDAKIKKNNKNKKPHIITVNTVQLLESNISYHRDTEARSSDRMSLLYCSVVVRDFYIAVELDAAATISCDHEICFFVRVSMTGAI